MKKLLPEKLVSELLMLRDRRSRLKRVPPHGKLEQAYVHTLSELCRRLAIVEFYHRPTERMETDCRDNADNIFEEVMEA